MPEKGKITKIDFLMHDGDPALLVRWENSETWGFCATNYEAGPGKWEVKSTADLVDRGRVLDEKRFKRIWPEIKVPDANRANAIWDYSNSVQQSGSNSPTRVRPSGGWLRT